MPIRPLRCQIALSGSEPIEGRERGQTIFISFCSIQLDLTSPTLGIDATRCEAVQGTIA